jgi:hypothetical protein
VNNRKKYQATGQARKAIANKSLLVALHEVFKLYTDALTEDPSSELCLQLSLALASIQDCLGTLNNGSEL